MGSTSSASTSSSSSSSSSNHKPAPKADPKGKANSKVNRKNQSTVNLRKEGMDPNVAMVFFKKADLKEVLFEHIFPYPVEHYAHGNTKTHIKIPKDG